MFVFCVVVVFGRGRGRKGNWRKTEIHGEKLRRPILNGTFGRPSQEVLWFLAVGPKAAIQPQIRRTLLGGLACLTMASSNKGRTSS